MKKMIVLLISVFSLLVVNACIAKDITIEISGYITDVFDPYNFIDGHISVGESFVGIYKYSLIANDAYPDNPIIGDYYFSSPNNLSLNVGNISFIDNAGYRITTKNNYTLDSYDSLTVDSLNYTMIWGDTVYNDEGEIKWFLKDSFAIALSDDSLPLSAPILQNWQENQLNIYRSVCGDSFIISGTVTSAIFVPEPSILAMLLVGASLFRNRTKRS